MIQPLIVFVDGNGGLVRTSLFKAPDQPELSLMLAQEFATKD
ncbi:hypothetical protein [Marinobacter sp. BGYM27]|nr:hypothetical protein [Marinobacter sp. BGYM27]MDG5498339.1 hypothetical protein [Marinobacter sp. BGYM27]